MLKIKQKKIVNKIGFILFGLLYFTAFTGLKINGIMQNLVAIVPLQVLVLIYFLYYQYKSKKVGKAHR